MEYSESEGVSLLENLPIEVITFIASYLEVEDVVQCCAASSTMREMFSDNAVWRPRCNKERAENLKKTPCKVAPAFVIPSMENSSLSLIPEWRISYMRENHLLNNWRKGKYVKEYIKDPNFSANSHMFYNNDCVIARYPDRIELLDVTSFPASDLVESVYFDTKISLCLKIEVANDMIVFMLGSGVQVFVLDLAMKKCQLKHTFWFENPLKSTFSGSQEEKNIFNVSKCQFKGKRLIMGNYFVGVLEGEPTMHIWNLETGQKLKEEVCLLKHSSVLEIKASATMNVVLTMGKATQETKTCLAYSLEKLKFLKFNETLNRFCVYAVHKDFVIFRFENTVQVYNYKKSQMLASMITDSFPKASGNLLLFIKNGDINVFNLIKNTTKALSLNYVTKFEVLGHKFLQMQNLGNESICEIDETNEEIKATNMKFHFQTCGFFTNKACTRYIVRENIGYILNFW